MEHHIPYDERIIETSSTMIDTLQISEELQKSGLDSKIAKTLAHQFKLVRQDILTYDQAKEHLSTKEDTNNVKIAIEKLRAGTQENISNVRAEIEKLRAGTQENISNVRVEIEKLRTESKEDTNKVKLEIEKLRTETSKALKGQTVWLSGLMITSFKIGRAHV